MRYVFVALALIIGGCAEGPATTAYKAYNACLAEKPADQCANEKARFDAAVVYANAQSQRLAAGGVYRPVPVVETYSPAPQAVRTGLICTTNGGVTICN